MNTRKYDIWLGNKTKDYVLDEFKNKYGNKKEFSNFRNSHSFDFIIKFYSGPFCSQKDTFINNVYLSDLLQLYHIDFYIKIELKEMVLRIERWLNTTILNLKSEKVIDDKTGIKRNNFGEVLDFYNNLDDTRKSAVFNRMKQVHNFNIDFDSFYHYLDAARFIRNYLMHHFPTVSHDTQYTSISSNIKDDNDDKVRVFIDDINCVISFFSQDEIKKIIENINKLINKFKWSDRCKDIVIKFYTNDLFPPNIVDTLSRNKKSSLGYLLKWKDKK